MAGCIRIPLGTEVGLGTDNIVLDRDPAPSSSPPPKRGTTPNFQPMSIVAKQPPISAIAELLSFKIGMTSCYLRDKVPVY